MNRSPSSKSLISVYILLSILFGGVNCRWSGDCAPHKKKAHLTGHAAKKARKVDEVHQIGDGNHWRVEVKLFPRQGAIQKDKSVRVSFGLPLPPGVLGSSTKVRVLSAKHKEIPSFVRALGVYRTIPPAVFLCSGLSRPKSPGIRSVLIQFEQQFTKTKPVSVFVDIGQKRTRSLPNEVNVRSLWRPVTKGTYADRKIKIDEPSVYAVLPARWLACSNLMSMATVQGELPILSAYDRGQNNFFYTLLNGPKANPKGVAEDKKIHFYTDYETWLYDRAMAFYAGYIRSGRFDFLREAHRAAEHYKQLLYGAKECKGDKACIGFFRLKNPKMKEPYKDSKYSYGESLATHFWLSGDPEAPGKIDDALSAIRNEIDATKVISRMDQWFTERHWANALLTALFDYEVNGNPEVRTYIRQTISALYANQTKPFPAGSSNPVNGCFNHNWEEDNKIGLSPWKMSLLVHALLRAYHTLGDERAPKMIVEAARCMMERALYKSNEHNNMLVPREEATSFGKPESLDGDPWSDIEHAVDAALVTALGAFFTKNAAQKKSFIEATKKLLASHARTLENWTRKEEWPNNHNSAYRVDPPRKYAWWYKNTSSIGWVLGHPTRLEGFLISPSPAEPKPKK